MDSLKYKESYNSKSYKLTGGEKKTNSNTSYDIITNQPILSRNAIMRNTNNGWSNNLNSNVKGGSNGQCDSKNIGGGYEGSLLGKLGSLSSNSKTNLTSARNRNGDSNILQRNNSGRSGNISNSANSKTSANTTSFNNNISTYTESLINESNKYNNMSLNNNKLNIGRERERDSELYTNYSLYGRKDKDKDLNKENNNIKEKDDSINSIYNMPIKSSIISSYNDNKSMPPSPQSTLLACKQTGLDNLGNTCFMNTSLQCLLHSEVFLRRLFQEKDRMTNSSPISKAFFELCTELLQARSSSVSPSIFKRVFGQSHRIFSGYSQHDTQEFLRVLLEDISKELNRVTHIPQYRELDTKINDKVKLNAEFDKLFKGREDSIVTDTFYGQIVNIFTCVDCSCETYSFEKFLDIPLLLESESYSGLTTFELLDEFFKNDKFKWDSPCENAKCRKKSFHNKILKMSYLPEVLILSFQRYNGRLRRKNSTKIDFDEKIDLSKYVDRDCVGSRTSKYNLYAVSNHTGSLDFGHYYAYVKIKDSWFEFNDSYVTRHNLGGNGSTAYVLFYQREDV